MNHHLGISIFCLVLFGTSILYAEKQDVNQEPPLSDLQNLLRRPLQFRDQESKVGYFTHQYKVVRLFPFDSEKNPSQELMSGQTMEISSRGVGPWYCGSRTYVKFENGGMIEAEETNLITEGILKLRPSQVTNKFHHLHRLWTKGEELFPNFVPKAPQILVSAQSKEEKMRALEDKVVQQQINESSSLIEAKRGSNENLFINSSDYSIGGWFKPDVRHGNTSMALITKIYTDNSRNESRPEWRVFLGGNVIYFQSFRDGFLNTENRYLSENEAYDFRQAHADYYDRYDYFDDVAGKVARARSHEPELVPKYILPPIVPPKKGDVTHPPIVPLPIPQLPMPPIMPHPPGLPPWLPPGGPPVIIPKPIPPGGVIGGRGQIVKVHSADIDLKHFWWSTSLGQCYGCLKGGSHTGVWHYITISVHLNDPLGPYLDFWIIQDDNPKLFGNRADIKSNVKHLRIEMNRADHSFSVLNPFSGADDLQRKCVRESDDDPCVRSFLQIGSINRANAYSGFMRGVYLAKKAFDEKEALDMAAQFYPDDSKTACTYDRDELTVGK